MTIVKEDSDKPVNELRGSVQGEKFNKEVAILKRSTHQTPKGMLETKNSQLWKTSPRADQL